MTETTNLSGEENELIKALMIEVATRYAKRNSFSSNFGSDGDTRTVDIQIRDDSFSHVASEGEVSITAHGTLVVNRDTYFNEEGERFRERQVYETNLALVLFSTEAAATGFRVDDGGKIEVFTGRVETVPEAIIHWTVLKNDSYDIWCREPQVLDSSFHAFASKYPAAVFVVNKVKELSRWQDARYV